MEGHDDPRVLNEYFAVFSDAGSVPTSLSGYGVGQQRHQMGLSAAAQGSTAVAPTAPRQPYIPVREIAGVRWQVTPTLQVQRYLNDIKAGAGTSGRLDAKTKAAYAKFISIFQEKRQLKLESVKMEDTKSLADKLIDRLKPNPQRVWMHPAVLSRLSVLSRKAVATNGATPAPAPTKPTKPSTTTITSTDEVQKILVALGVDPARITDKAFGPTTKAKWQAATQARKLNTTITGRTGAARVSVNRVALAAMRAAASSAMPVAATDHVVPTSEVQSIVLRLGAKAPGTELTDGTYGGTTAGFWAQSAEKRRLDPYMAKKTADGKTVVVRKDTFFKLLADADSKVPPVAAVGLKSLDPALIARDSKAAMTMLLNVIQPVNTPTAPTGIITRYQLAAQRLKLDDRIEEDASVTGACGNNSGSACPTYVVIKKSLEAMVKRFQTMSAAPPAPPPGPQKTQLDLDIARLIKEATTSVKTNTVRVAINAAIQDKRLSPPAVPAVGPWAAGLQNPLIGMLGVDPKAMGVWQHALAPGKLVSLDGNTVKLPPKAAQFIKSAAAALLKAKKAAVERYVGFTKINAAEVIARINGLGATTVRFDRAGGAKELADAIKTFLKETGRAAPPGDLVRTDPQNNTYVKNSVLSALAKAVSETQQRASSTAAFRARMVDNALKAATGKMSVREYQQAVRDTILSAAKIPPATEKIFKTVTITGAFDKPTRAAYTETVRTVIIGPAVQEYQRLLQEQLGPNFKTVLVEETRNQVWNAFLEKSVTKQNGTLMMATLPNIANLVALGAKHYQDNTAADVRHAEEAAALQKALAEAVRKSTAILSMVNVQQGLKQMAADGSFSMPALSITGVADVTTRRGLFEVSGMIFPEGFTVPETTWAQYLGSVGFVVAAGAKLKRAWVGANYIALPPALTDLLAKQAGKWIAAHGPAPIQKVDFQHPSVVSVKMPPKDVVFDAKEEAKKIVESPKPAAKTSDEEQAAAAQQAAQVAATQQQAQQQAVAEAAEAGRRAQLLAQKAEQERLTKEQAAAAAAQARQVAAEATQRQQAATDAGDVAAANKAAAEAQQAAAVATQQAQAAHTALLREQQTRQEQNQQQTAAEAGGAQVTGPTISITTAAPSPAPVAAGMGGGAIALLVAGGVGLALALKGDDRG